MIQCPPAIQRELDRLQLTCLDEQWLTRNERYRFRCQQGHEFSWQADVLISLSACPACRNAGKLGRMLAKAALDGSECLDQWLGVKAQYRFRCLSNPDHQWTRGYTLALRYAGCPDCKLIRLAQRRRRSDGLQRLQDYARSRGGECLSPKYLGVDFKHEFRCAHGHTWSARAGHVLGKKNWCSQCLSAQQRHGLDVVRATAAAQGGRFLSDEYSNSGARYQWACAHGHTWTATYASIRAGTWCPHCATERRRLDLKTLQQAALARGGRCLSETYTTTRVYYLWQCAHGHTWKAQYDAIRNGHWCYRCHVQSRRFTVADLHQTARDRDGLCLSTHYEGTQAHYHWQCVRGHTWRALFRSVRSGTWCPICYHMSLTKPGSAAWRRYQTHQPRD